MLCMLLEVELVQQKNYKNIGVKEKKKERFTISLKENLKSTQWADYYKA